MSTLKQVLQTYLHDHESSWAISCLGAVAEFHWVGNETPITLSRDRLCLATERGAIRIKLTNNIRPIPFESLSAYPQRWLHGVSLCLPTTAFAHSPIDVLTEVGPDRDAICPEHRDQHLFNLGIGGVNVDAHVRTADPELIDILRADLGQSILREGSAAMSAIKLHSPHRVFTSVGSRIEVYQVIGSISRGIPTPHGPHTHVLPKLLASGRTHMATQLIPPGFAPTMQFFPPNPIIDTDGNEQKFDQGAFDRFAQLLTLWGEREYIAEKKRAWRALADGVPPDTYTPPNTRTGRTATRIAIRQYAQMTDNTHHVSRWKAAFDPTKEPADQMAAH